MTMMERSEKAPPDAELEQRLTDGLRGGGRSAGSRSRSLSPAPPTAGCTWPIYYLVIVTTALAPFLVVAKEWSGRNMWPVGKRCSTRAHKIVYLLIAEEEEDGRYSL